MFRSIFFGLFVACSVVSAQLEPPKLFRLSEPLVSSESSLARVDGVSYRLPNNTIPSHYDVELWTRVDQNDFDFQGTVKITLTALEATNNITIHARQLTIEEVSVRPISSEPYLANVVFSEEVDTEFLVVEIPEGLVQNGEYVLFVNFSGVLRTDDAGFYRSSYVNEDGDRVYLATTQFESTDARHGFPCYDETALRATFDIRITHGKNYTAESNMPVRSITESTDDEDTVVTVFETTPRMPTYLVAYVISDFAFISKNTGVTPQRLFAAANKIHDGEFSLDIGVLLLDKLAEYLDVEFSLPKMDQFAIPDFAAGAMENWGLVTYREPYLLYNETLTAYNYKTYMATIVAHEYAHQWFGNLVTPKWWTYLWLNEGFATLFEVYATDLVLPEWKIMDDFAVSTCQYVLGYDLGTMRPMTHYVESPDEIDGIFDNIAYSKSGCVLRMWQNAFSEATFKKGLKYYLDKMAYSAAVEEDLFEGLATAIEEDSAGALPEDADLNAIFYSWTRQSGYPLVTVARDYATGEINLSQTPFRADNLPSSTLWSIPFAYATAASTEFDTKAVEWMPMSEQHKISNTDFNSNDWFILNNQQTGYYRVNYDDRNWELIIAALEEDHTKIHVVNRAQLIDDAFQMARYNVMDYKIPLQLFDALRNDLDQVPWQALSNNIGYVNRLMRGHADFSNYEAFVRSTVDKLYTTLGVRPVADEFYFNAYTRAIAINLACSMGHEACLADTHTRFLEEMNSGIQLEPDLQSSVYCNALRTGASDEFLFLWRRLQTSTNDIERSRIISSLTCVQDEELIYSLLQAALGTASDNTLSYSERLQLINTMYQRGPEHVKVVFRFFADEEYKSTFIAFFGIATYSNVITSIASYVVTEELLALSVVVVADTTLDTYTQNAFASIVYNNLAWIATQGPTFTAFLNEDEPDSAGAIAFSVVTLLAATFVGIKNVF